MTTPNDQTLNALENERRYVAKELHDGVAQTVLQLGLQIGICQKLLERGKTKMLGKELNQLEQRIQLASGQIRELIADMRPTKIDPEAPVPAQVQHLIDLHHERGGPPVTYQVNVADISLTPLQILALNRIIQESLLNIRKHAEAQQVQVDIVEDDALTALTIADDGPGFDLAEITTRSTDKGGAGLANLQARAEAAGLKLELTTGSTGTTVVVTWPK
jgi:signal transduction histidine kinase